MYFAGIYIHENPVTSSAVIVEKVLRNARKEYVIQDIRILPSPDKPNELFAEIRSLYQDPSFLRKKKVFSQDRRPPKNTFTPPILVMASKTGDPSLICGLRDDQIPVDGLFFYDEEGWKREELKILRFGSNLHVNPKDMKRLEAVMISSMAVTMDETIAHAGALLDEMDRCRGLIRAGVWPDVFQQEGFRFLPALFLALWHCEAVKQIKRY